MRLNNFIGSKHSQPNDVKRGSFLNAVAKERTHGEEHYQQSGGARCPKALSHILE